MKPHPVYLKAAKGDWIDSTDLAKLIRTALAAKFTGQKFSVRSEKYSGGSAVNIHWHDGPTTEQVNPIVNQFKTRSFDGMIDMAHDSDLWIYPDGSAHTAHDPGTEGSRGSNPEIIESAKSPDAVLVTRVCGAYISTCRYVCGKAYHAAIAELRAQNWVSLESVDWSLISVVEDSEYGARTKGVPCVQFGGARMWLDSEISHRAHQVAYPETLPDQEPESAPVVVAHTPCLCW